MTLPIVRQSAIQDDVPGYLAKPIGHIIVKWAFLEDCLTRFIWELAEVDPNVGRVAISSPRAPEKLDNIRDLLFLKRKIMMEEKVFSKLRSRVKDLNELRDSLCHGQWVNDADGWAIVSTRGYVTDQAIERIERSRKFRPERKAVTASTLALISAQISELISAVENLRQHSSSPEKLHKRHLRRQRPRSGDKRSE